MQDALIINTRDLEFQLFEVLEAETLTQRARHADHSRETFNAALDTAHAVAAESIDVDVVLAPFRCERA